MVQASFPPMLEKSCGSIATHPPNVAQEMNPSPDNRTPDAMPFFKSCRHKNLISFTENCIRTDALKQTQFGISYDFLDFFPAQLLKRDRNYYRNSSFPPYKNIQNN